MIDIFGLLGFLNPTLNVQQNGEKKLYREIIQREIKRNYTVSFKRDFNLHNNRELSREGNFLINHEGNFHIKMFELL